MVPAEENQNEKDLALAEELAEVGNRLLQLPSDTKELLDALNRVEDCLSTVGQSPSIPVQKALIPSMKAFLSDDLLRHPDVDVKASLASCVSEVTRITAPTFPYNDRQMKNFLPLIVSIFERLSNTSDPSYSKRASALVTMAKVRSCLMMLDLQCDALIVEMFHHFLKSLRPNHPEYIFSSMKTIMSLVLEESDDISPELLSPLLFSVQKENKFVLQIERKLAEQVLEACASKLKPCLMQAVQFMGMSVNDFSKVVATICQGTSDTVGRSHIHLNGSVEHMEAKDMGLEASLPGKANILANTVQKLLMISGTRTIENITSVKSLLPQNKSKQFPYTTNRLEPDCSDSRMVELETKTRQASKRKKDQKTSLSIHSTRISDHYLVDSEKEDAEQPVRRKSHHTEASNVSLGQPSKLDSTMSLGNGRGKKQLLLQTKSQSETLRSASSPSSKILDDRAYPKRDHRPKKEMKRTRDADPAFPSVPERSLSSDHAEEDLSSPAVIIKCQSGGLQRTSLRTTHIQVKEEISGTTHSVKDFGENLVGLKVKVWWPLDKMFYEGVIDSFDPVKNKHKVSYVDGDTETLNLKRERWEFVGGGSVANRVKVIDSPSSQAFPEIVCCLRAVGTSAGKSKGKVPKSVIQCKDNGKLGWRSKDETLNVSSKSKFNSGSVYSTGITKTSSKQVGANISGFQSKDDTPITMTDGKCETPTGVKTQC